MQGMLHRFHRDPSHQFLGLSKAIHKLEATDSDPAALEAAETALEQLLDEHGPAIRAGLNTGSAAETLAGEDPERLQAFRDSYREAVLGFESLLQSYQAIVERFGTAAFGDAARALIQGAGDDMASKGPSIDPADLQQIVSDIYKLEVLVTVHEACGGLLSSMASDHGIPVRPAEALLSELLPLTGDRWIKGERLVGISESFGAREPTPQIAFLRRLTAVIRDIPPPIYGDIEVRDRLVGAAQDALDVAIGRET
jgi:type III secretion protein W